MKFIKIFMFLSFTIHFFNLNVFAQHGSPISKTANNLHKLMSTEIRLDGQNNFKYLKLNKATKQYSFATIVDSIMVVEAGDYKYRYHYSYTNNYSYSSILEEKWINNAWINYSLTNYEYNSNGDITLLQREKYVRIIYNYDSNNNLTLWRDETWSDGQWRNHRQFIYTYDLNGNRTSEIHSKVGATIEYELTNISKETYSYDINNNIIETIFESWLNDQWDLDGRGSYSYDANNNLITELYESILSNQWKNRSLFSYVYDSNQNMISEKRENWGGSQWVGDYSYTYTFNINNEMTSKLYKRWEDNQWANISTRTFTYDGNINPTMELYESWDDSNWVMNSRNIYQFDNNVIYGKSEVWDNSQWVEGKDYLLFYDSFGRQYYNYSSEITAYCRQVTDMEEDILNKKSFILSQNYPNPFNPSTTISYSIPQSNLVQLNVYDILGSKIAVLVNKEQTSGDYKVEFNASNLTSGIYFYRLQSGSFTETKKLILLR